MLACLQRMSEILFIRTTLHDKNGVILGVPTGDSILAPPTDTPIQDCAHPVYKIMQDLHGTCNIRI
jgi:hypothetical protein